MKTKTQISFTVTAKLISTFVFAAPIVQFLYFLDPKAIICTCIAGFVLELFGHHIVGFLVTYLILVSEQKLFLFSELSDTELTESGVEDTESLNTPDTLVTTDNSKTHDDEDEEAGETEKRYIIEDKLSKRGEKR